MNRREFFRGVIGAGAAAAGVAAVAKAEPVQRIEIVEPATKMKKRKGYVKEDPFADYDLLPVYSSQDLFKSLEHLGSV